MPEGVGITTEINRSPSNGKVVSHVKKHFAVRGFKG